jgi:hypothetical protein
VSGVKYVEHRLVRIVLKIPEQQHQNNARQGAKQGKWCMVFQLYPYISNLFS